MDGLDQIEAFGIELEKLIDRFHAEFEVPPAAMVGVLTMVATRLSCEQFYEIDMDDEDGLWDG